MQKSIIRLEDFREIEGFLLLLLIARVKYSLLQIKSIINSIDNNDEGFTLDFESASLYSHVPMR
jgi:hypothetical protein